MRFIALAVTLVATVAALLLGGCAVPIVSESELETESGKQFQEMRAQIPASTDVRARAYINCVSAAIVPKQEMHYVKEAKQMEDL